QMGDLDTKFYLLTFGAVFRLGQQALRRVEKCFIQVSSRWRIIDVRVNVRTPNLLIEQRQVGAHVRGGLAEIPPQKFVREALHVGFGIPKQFRQQVGPQWAHLAESAGRRISLLEDSFDAALPEKADVWLEHAKIRKRLLVMSEIRGVVPNV